jgi:serine/threonine protein kinase
MRCSSCPSRTDLSAFLRGELAYQLKEAISDHLIQCNQCGTVVRELESSLQDPVITVRALINNRKPLRSNSASDNPVSSAVLEAKESSKAIESQLRNALSDSQLRLPLDLGQYRLLEKIGAGGMGTVYLAEHHHLKKRVAVKLLPPERMSDSSSLARFHREMEVVGRLDHTNIVRATDAGEVDSVHFLVMEFIDGINLHQIIRRCGPLSVADACELVRQTAHGLQHAHENGLVHRDIKPQNLMLTPKGEVKVLDLGLALLQRERFTLGGLTGSGQVMGTADYMAPEQWEDCHWVDIRADVYSLGCTLFFLLKGHPPFGVPGNESVVRKMAAHLRDDPMSLQEHMGEVSDLLVRMLAKDPADRPQTPGAVLHALKPLTGEANLQLLFERASKRPVPKGDITLSHVQEALPPSSLARATSATVSLRARNNRRYRRKIAIACFIVAVAGTIIATLSWSLTHDPGPTPVTAASTTTPDSSSPSRVDQGSEEDQAPPEILEVGKWATLLKNQPRRRSWPKKNAGFTHDSDQETVSVQSHQASLLGLGRTTTQDYRLLIGVQQPGDWSGVFGVYIGGHKDETAGKFHYQVICFEKTIRGPVLSRKSGTIEDVSPPFGTNPFGFAEEPLILKPDSRVHTLEIHVQPHNLMEISWDNHVFETLTAPEYDDKVGEADFHGEFGIFCDRSSAIISTARILQSRESKK